MADKKWRLGYGNESNISSAIEAGKLDGSDLIITKDTKRVAFVRPADNSVLFSKSKLETFDTVEAANTYAESDTSAYAGELISVLVNGKYKTYRLQSAKSGYTIEDINSDIQTKQYVRIMDKLPESDQEEGVIYIVGPTGSIWTGSKWKVVFEDVASVEDRIKVYVNDMMENIVSAAPGIVDENNPLPSSNYKAGQTWRVAADGMYSGQKCEVGDLIICVTDYVVDSASDSDFIIVQANINGAVTGPEAVEDNELVVFSGVSGKVLKQSGIQLDKIQEVIEKSHEHKNKEILDSYTKTQAELLSDVDNRLRHSEPYIHGNELILNGYGAVIEKKDDSTNTAKYFMSGNPKSIDFPAGYNIIGGCLNDNCHSASIIVNNGNIKNIYGGADGDGSVSEVSIVLNGGTVVAVCGAGAPDLQETGKANHTGKVSIVVNNTDNTVMVYGGGYSYAAVGETEVIINGGTLNYLTAGGSNGFTGNGKLIVHGGTITTVQAVNRGFVGAADILIDGGTVNALYAGVEPDNGDVMTTATGTVGHTTMHLLGGTINGLYAGANNSVNDFDPTGIVSGVYYDGVLQDNTQAEKLNLTKITKSDVEHKDLEQAKQDAIAASKEYTNSVMTFTEF